MDVGLREEPKVTIPTLTQQKRWLILSHAFNMDGRAASQTITDKIPYLLAAGVEPIVLSGISGLKDQRFPHHQYLAWGPAGLRFDFRHWIANRYGRGVVYNVSTSLVSIALAPFVALERLLLGYSSQWSWVFPAFFHGRKLIKAGKVDVVFSVGSAWSAHLAGVWLKKATGIELISEVHDPMVIRKDENDQGIAKPKKSRCCISALFRGAADAALQFSVVVYGRCASLCGGTQPQSQHPWKCAWIYGVTWG